MGEAIESKGEGQKGEIKKKIPIEKDTEKEIFMCELQNFGFLDESSFGSW